ncbi:MAG: hypothetical protein ABEI11_03370 [Haloarculaceae archaeon]
MTPALTAASLQDGSNGEGGALGDVIVDALQALLRVLFTPMRSVIETHGDAILRTIVGTPHPNAVFSAPTNNAWPGIHAFYWETIIPLALSLYGLAVGLVIFFETTSHLFSGYHRAKLKRRAFSGLLGILGWWWMAAFSLRFVDALAGVLVPSVADLTLFETLSFGGMGVLGTVIALSTNFALFVLIGLIYLARELALYLFVLLMPILIVLWIPGVGPFALVARFMRKLAGFYVPFLFMTVPVALLFRLGELLGTSADLSAGGFGAWLTALVIPVLAVLSPLVLFWQAGLVFFVADRAARRVSTERARTRLATGREGVQRTRRGGRNLVRGVRNEPAVASDGQYVLDSGGSRAHATGRRLDNAGSRLRTTLERAGNGLAASEDSDGGVDDGVSDPRSEIELRSGERAGGDPGVGAPPDRGTSAAPVDGSGEGQSDAGDGGDDRTHNHTTMRDRLRAREERESSDRNPGEER